MAAFWTYDYACSLQQEVMKLFMISLGFHIDHNTLFKVDVPTSITLDQGKRPVYRYAIRALSALHRSSIYELHSQREPGEMPDAGQYLLRYISFPRDIHAFLIPFIQAFLSSGTYALWSNNRFVLAAMVAGFLAAVVASIITTFAATTTAPFATSAIPGITGCLDSVDLLIPFIFLFLFELGLMSLTLVPAIQSWRMSNGPLYAILVKHNIFYYACVFSAANLLTLLLLRYQYHAMFQDFQCIILAILATRMHLHLWNVDRHLHASGAFVCISLPDMSPVDRVV
ncbi:hypothetical protein DFH29DRAFT_1042951 [Suillus ampliporus]|nr:hypothetical protein DFH29DRAFT_1042951 [Suillus ampliporus]